MSEVSTVLNGKIYVYKHNGRFYTWFDQNNLPVPVLIHTRLREQTIAEGKNPEIFLSEPTPPHSEKTNSKEKESKAKESQVKKVSTKGFNPFANKGE